MAELSSTNNRLVFKKGDQNKLLREFMVSENQKQSEVAIFFSIVPRSFTDWLREKTKLPLSAYNKIPKQLRKKYIPIENIDQYWYAKKGSKLGYKKVIEKYGKLPKNEARRKASWLRWWNSKGRKTNKVIGKTKPFKKPEFSNELAEFVGAVLGDGGIQEYQITISFNLKKDKEYSEYIIKLIKKLFGLEPEINIIKKSNVINVRISRKEITLILESMGLKRGNKTKHQLGIPEWIKKDITYSKYCVRGLIDTDGCVIVEKHKKSEQHSYPRLNFTNCSENLIDDVFEILKTLNLEPKIRRDGKAVQVENLNKICHYFEVISSSNPRILDRWLNTWRDG